jgi:hypothetical protein
MNAQNAADKIRELHKTFKALEKGLELADFLVGAEQNEKETKERVEKLRAEEGKLTSTRDEILSAASKIKAQSEIELTQAKAKAEGILSIAQREADKLKVDAQKALENAKQTLDQANARDAASKKEALEVKAQITAEQAKLDEIRKKIASVKGV